MSAPKIDYSTWLPRQVRRIRLVIPSSTTATEREQGCYGWPGLPQVGLNAIPIRHRGNVPRGPASLRRPPPEAQWLQAPCHVSRPARNAAVCNPPAASVSM